MKKALILFWGIVVFSSIFLAISEINYLYSCCPRSSPPPKPTPPPPVKPVQPEAPPDQTKPPDTPPDAPIPGVIGPTTPGTQTPKTASPGVKGRPRPALSFGIQPLIQSMDNGPNALFGVVDPWEVWWSRNRDSYLHFKEPIQWMKVITEGTSTSVLLSPAYDELIGVLGNALADKDHYLAFRAAIALGKVRDATDSKICSPKALEILKKAHESETRYFVRNNILLALGLTGDASVSDTIKAVLQSNDPPLRRSYAALAAGFLPYDNEISKILKGMLLNRENWEVKCCACLALGNLKDASAVPLLGGIINAMGGANKEQSQIKAYAALGLGRIGNDKALAELKKCTPATERDTDVKSAVVVALGQTGLPGAKEPLIAFLQDRNALVRGLAAISLGMLKDPKSFDIIFEHYKKNKLSDAEGLMLLGLALTGDNKAKPELRQILESKKHRILLRGAAAVGLGLLKDTQSSPSIIKMLEDSRQLNDVILSPYLVLSLGMIQDPKAVDVLQRIWNETNSNNPHLLAYHTNLGVGLTLLGKKNDIVLPKLVKQVEQTDDALLRTYALHTLSLISDKDSAKLFISSFEDKNTYVRFSTVNGIGFLMDANEVSALNKITSNSVDIQMQIMNHILPIPVW